MLRKEIIDEITDGRGCRVAQEVLRWAGARAESVGETRLRLLTLRLGAPAPLLQWCHSVAGNRYYIDLGWDLPGIRIGAECDGEEKYDDQYRVLPLEKGRAAVLREAGIELIQFTRPSLHFQSHQARSLVAALQRAGVMGTPPMIFLGTG